MTMTFEQWLIEVDNAFVDTIGLPRDSWPDQDYWAMYDAGDTPQEAVKAAIENEYGEEALEAFNLV
jgi:hypothetical protein